MGVVGKSRKNKGLFTISLKDYSKFYSDRRIFSALNLDIRKGEFACIIGPNGCGKSTLLMSIAGLIAHGGKIIRKGNISYAGQDPREMLLPWLTIKSNILFPSNEKQSDRKFLGDLLDITFLHDYAEHYPYQISGGMAQLLLLARALMNKAEVILLDEPFKSLDFQMARRMQQAVLALWGKYKPTIVMVSHDLEQAVFMADRIIVFSDKPTRIKRIIDINLPRPRRFSLITSNEFTMIKEEVLNAFYN